jgi:RNA polymerase sigma-70 factor (ECF subfamily)
VSDLLTEYVPRVYRFARRLTSDAHAAEDLTQETFLRAWRHRARLRHQRSARVWLFTIAANLWRDQLRRRKPPAARPARLDDQVCAPAHPPDRDLCRQEDVARALDALEALPDRQRQVLYLNACESLSVVEIAHVLGITVEATKASLSLGRKKVQAELRDLFEELYPRANQKS